MNDPNRGLYHMYTVNRIGDPPKHRDCWYFVLDIQHDEHARVALAAYAESCRESYPLLARDLTEKLRSRPS